MSMSDPIADMLTRVRNGIQARFSTVEMPTSRVKEEICAVLKREGYINDFSVEPTGVQPTLRVKLRYTNDNAPVIQGIQRVSKPSMRVYVRSADIKPVRSGLGISIVSTSRGLMTGKQARTERVGGEVLCEVW